MVSGHIFNLVFVLLGVLVVGFVIMNEILMGLGLDMRLELALGAKGCSDFASADVNAGLAFASCDGTHIIIGVGLGVVLGCVHNFLEGDQLGFHPM